MISSNKDCIYTNMLTNKDIDIDEKFDIQAIKEVKYDHEENSFYILANKLGGKLGFFVIKMQASAPENYKFLVRWKNKLDIDDTKIVVLRDRKKGYKELCISFKTIFINTFNVMILDMKQDPKYSKNSIIFRHESFQLWESKCDSALLSKNNDFIIINRDGINVLALGSVDKRPIKDVEGNDRVMHSLEAYSYLKLDPSNSIVFANQNMNKREIQIVQEYEK